MKESLDGQGSRLPTSPARRALESPMVLLRSNRHTKGRFRPAPAIVLAVLITAAAVRGQAIEEYQSKAVFLYNVAKFVEWPTESFESPGAPIVSCILGENALGGSPEQAANGKIIGDRKFVLRHISDVRQCSGCHILFVSSSERKRWRSILDGARSKGILTVGEADGFASEGGVINFKLAGDRIRIQVNLEAAEQEKLRISSRLLGLSEIVKEQPR